MTLILDISPELQTELTQLAASRGQDAVTFATSTLEASVRSLREVSDQSSLAPAQKAKDVEIDEILDQLALIGADLPASNDLEMHSRANLYEGHD